MRDECRHYQNQGGEDNHYGVKGKMLDFTRDLIGDRVE